MYATERQTSIDELINEIVNDPHSASFSMSAAVRVHVVRHFRDKAIKLGG
jgi:predicted DNA-binding ribbon-helix-helix protein